MKDEEYKANNAVGEPTGAKRVMLRLSATEEKKAKDPADAEASSDDGDIKILFEDNHLLVAVKPQGILSQSDVTGDTDFLTMLKGYLVKKYDKPGDAYLGLLHRLDRPTGGVMVFAKTSKAAARMSEQFRNDGIDKTYLAVTSGRPSAQGRIRNWLVKDERSNTVTIAPSTLTGAKLAETDVHIAAESDGLSLVTAKLVTGRSHQVRVQLKGLGAPIVGDMRYAGNKYVKSRNLALWSYSLKFTHPVSGDAMTFISEPPFEFPWNLFDVQSLFKNIRPVGTHYGAFGKKNKN